MSPRFGAGGAGYVDAPTNPGSVSVTGLRPAPDRRTRPAGTPTSGSSKPLTAAVNMIRDTPVARATADTPPRPSARASNPGHTRR